MALITSGCAPFRPTASGPRSSTPPAGWLISRLACRSVVAYSCNPYGEPLLQLYADREWAGFRRRYGAATPRLRQLSARPAASCGGGDRRAPWTSLPGLPSLSDPGHRIFHLRLGLRPMQSSPLSRPAPWTSVVTVARPQRWRGRNGGEAATVARQQRWRGSDVVGNRAVRASAYSHGTIGLNGSSRRVDASRVVATRGIGRCSGKN